MNSIFEDNSDLMQHFKTVINFLMNYHSFLGDSVSEMQQWEKFVDLDSLIGDLFPNDTFEDGISRKFSMRDFSPVINDIKSDIRLLIANGISLNHPVNELDPLIKGLIDCIKSRRANIDGKCLIFLYSIRMATIKVGMLAEVRARAVRGGIKGE